MTVVVVEAAMSMTTITTTAAAANTMYAMDHDNSKYWKWPQQQN